MTGGGRAGWGNFQMKHHILYSIAKTDDCGIWHIPVGYALYHIIIISIDFNPYGSEVYNLFQSLKAA